MSQFKSDKYRNTEGSRFILTKLHFLYTPTKPALAKICSMTKKDSSVGYYNPAIACPTQATAVPYCYIQTFLMC